MNADLQMKIDIWRQKAIAKTLTVEDMVEAAAALREGRRSAAATSAGATTKRASAAKAAILPNGDDLLGELMA